MPDSREHGRLEVRGRVSKLEQARLFWLRLFNRPFGFSFEPGGIRLSGQSRFAKLTPLKNATIRERLNRDKAVCVGVAFLAMAGFLLSTAVLRNLAIGLVCLGIFALCLVTGLISVICPRCKTAWGPLLMNSGTVFSIDRRVVACPFCRSEVDLPPDDPAQPELE